MNAYEFHANNYLINNDCTLVEMYRRIGVPLSNHQKYIKGRIPMIAKGYKIAKFLNIEIQELWGLDNDK